MSKPTLTVFLVASGLVTGTAAWAGSWADYAASFPVFPCQDGWMGCVVDGTTITPDLQKGKSGLPAPSDLRVGWDLEPTASFSPFVRLSVYSGAPPAVVAALEPEPPTGSGEPTEPSEGVADAGGEQGSGDANPGGRSDGGNVAAPVAGEAETHARAPSGGGDDGGGAVRPPGAGGSLRPSNGGGDARPPDPGASSMVRPPGDPGGSVRPPDAGGSVRPPSAGSGERVADPGGTPAPVVPPPVAPKGPEPVVPTGPATCDNLTQLEPQAMLGKLSDGQLQCLEGVYASAPKPTDKDKVSRVLMANAYSKGDIKAWEKLIKRHLDEVDQSDADLSYKYALYLAKGGVGRATGTIRWANAALENATVWTGDTFQSRVSTLHKIRSAAAQSMWKAAEEANVQSPTDDTKKKVDESRNLTKTYAREWYEYAKSAGKDPTLALQLCTSAAGTQDFCEGH